MAATAKKNKEFDMERFAGLVLQEFESIGKRFDAVDARFDAIDARFDSQDARLDRMEGDIHAIKVELAYIHKRLDDIEAKVESNSGFAKEIDYLMERIANIEKYLGISGTPHTRRA
jgi:tetrahydromethanopterin S-methyltransferase subunit G